MRVLLPENLILQTAQFTRHNTTKTQKKSKQNQDMKKYTT